MNNQAINEQQTAQVTPSHLGQVHFLRCFPSKMRDDSCCSILDVRTRRRAHPKVMAAAAASRSTVSQQLFSTFRRTVISYKSMFHSVQAWLYIKPNRFPYVLGLICNPLNALNNNHSLVRRYTVSAAT